MNLTKLKNYAPIARAAIITAVTRRAAILGIQPGRVEEVTESGDVALIGGQPFPRSIVPLRKQLLDLIQRDGFDQTMEAMAYTWFNRLVALRFMELHDGWLDHGYRVLSHPQGTSLPEILQHAEHVDLKGLDREEVIRHKLDGNRDEDLYRLLLLAQCAELNHILPDVFSRLDDATILLLPDNLLHSDSVIRQLVAGSDAEDWQQVEVLGWLYQFYISERKDAVMARKSAVPTEDIPAVTQLFTPHWIVRYLVENSLGRLWLNSRPNSRLRDHMPYYIEDANSVPSEQSAVISEKGNALPSTTPTDLFSTTAHGSLPTDHSELTVSKPEEIRLCDPAVGSAHMLTYAFDLLVLIYEEEGYAANDIPGLILTHNLHGLEICPRAAQLAELALVFKAREKSRRFFSPGNLVRPHIIELRDVRFAENELRDYIHALGLGDLFNQPMLRLLHQFEEAKNFGSLIQPCLDERAIADVRRAIEAKDLGGQLFLRETHLKVLRVLEQAEALTQRYHVVVANPPYMGGKGMNPSLKEWLGINYPDERSDLMTCFMERCGNLTIPTGFWAMINLPSWMFLSSYAILRSKLISTQTIRSLLHLGRGLFGPDFGTVAFVVQKHSIKGSGAGVYRRLFDKQVSVRRPEEIEALFLTPSYNAFSFPQSDFRSIPGCPIAYWVKPKFARAFSENPSFSELFAAKQGMATGNNERFLRFWHEVALSKLDFNQVSYERFSSDRTWFPYSKGGEARKWYGNHELVINWENNGEHLKEYKDADGKRLSTLKNLSYLFAPAITWSLTAISGILCTRFRPSGFVFDTNGMSAFPKSGQVTNEVGVALLNSIVGQEALKVLNPTMAFQSGDIDRVPITRGLVSFAKDLKITELIDLARADWDNFETSWDFRDQPLLRPGLKGATLEASWRNWEAQSTAAIRRMQELETENNRLFIAAYGLDGELQPEVPEAQITLARAEARRDMAAFLSYAVGCMMGRYSPDHPGLILANAGDSLREFLEKVGKPLAELTFAPDEDGIIPVLDGEWFEDDIVARTRDFLRSTFGEATLNENLRFIEDSLGKELRTYFLNDFYKDHLQTYKNRPIYWQLSSGKQKAFQCLVYLHRYTPATLARIRTEYAIPLQGKLSARITRLEEDVIQTASSAARKKLQTDLDKCKKQIVELLAFDEQLRSYADQAITLDLDDGVKANYAKFGTLVAEPKKVCGTKED